MSEILKDYYQIMSIIQSSMRLIRLKLVLSLNGKGNISIRRALKNAGFMSLRYAGKYRVRRNLFFQCLIEPRKEISVSVLKTQ